MKRLLVLLALLPVLLALNSCGGAPAAAPTISVTGANTSVNVNGTVQFTADHLNLSSTLVNWQVNGVQSGNSRPTAQSTRTGCTQRRQYVPTNNVVTITAVAQAQTSLTATANLTILPAAAISTISCVNPQTELSSQTVASGTSLLCTPTVAGGGNIAVYWYVNNSPTCSSTLGVLGGQYCGHVGHRLRVLNRVTMWVRRFRRREQPSRLPLFLRWTRHKPYAYP